MVFILYSVGIMFLNLWKMYDHFITFKVLKCCKKNSLIYCIVLEFFWTSLYTNHLSYLHKNFQVSSLNDVYLGYQIWISCYYLFLSCDGYRLTHRHKINCEKRDFLIQGTLKHVILSKTYFKNLNQTDGYNRWVRKK